MSIIRVSKNKKNPYVIINKTGINDKNLSLKAKGLLTYLLSKPDNWYVNYHDIILNNLNGLESVKSAVKELLSHGYIVRTQTRSNNGQFGYFDYVVYEKPSFYKFKKNKLPPQMGKPSAVKPLADNNNLLYNDNSYIIKKTTTTSHINSKSISLAGVDFLKLNKKTSAILLLTELDIKNHKNLFELFLLDDILTYSKWIKEKHFKMKNPTGFLITALKERWMDNIDPDSNKKEVLLFYYRCKQCNHTFGYEEEFINYTFCNKCSQTKKDIPS